jgi:hypothetical protein
MYALHEIVKAIGLEASLRLIAGWGGRSLCIPDKYSPDHILTKVLGEEAALNLELTYGGQTIAVPKVDLRSIDLEVRVVKTVEELGASPYFAAWAFKVSKERVKQILRKHRR